MDIALAFNPSVAGLDISLAAGDLRGDDTLTTAVLLSLMCDGASAEGEVHAGDDRRGWWADAYSGMANDSFGSRLWLLKRSKLVPGAAQTTRQHILSALQWLVDDGLVRNVEVTVFQPATGWLYADVQLTLLSGERRLRLQWNAADGGWHLAGELWTGAANAI